MGAMSLRRRLKSIATQISKTIDKAQALGDIATLEADVRSELIPKKSPVEAELPWASITRALLNSPDPMDRRSLFLGLEATTRALVHLPIETLWAHGYISGASDAGKTSRTLLPLALQLIALRDLESDKTPKPPLYRGPLLIIDLKGEDYFINTVREAAAKAHRPFRFFTNHPLCHTHAFNPVMELRSLGVIRGDLRDHMRLSMNLEHGGEYGKEHFAALNRQEFDQLLESLPDAQTFGDLAAALPGPQDPGHLNRKEAQRRENSVSLRMAIKDLAEVPGMNLRPEDNAHAYAESIQMRRAFIDDEVLYFYLRGRPQEAVARIIGAFAIECFYAASRSYNKDNPPEAARFKHGYVFVDEFQNIAGRNFDGFMETARTEGLALLLASQSLEKLQSQHLAHAIEDSTSFRQWYSARTPAALKYLRDISGDTETLRPGRVTAEVTARGLIVRPVNREFEVRDAPRFSTNDLNAIDAEPGMSLVRLGANRDRAQYAGATVATFMPYAMPYADFQRLSVGSWPEGPALISNMPPAELPIADAPPGHRSLPWAAPLGAEDAAKVQAVIKALASARPPASDTELARALDAITISATGYPPKKGTSEP